MTADRLAVRAPMRVLNKPCRQTDVARAVQQVLHG
jgi:hypothetical protein